MATNNNVNNIVGALQATSINFGGSTLSNYIASGTFTPTITFSTPGNLSVSYATQTGFYSRIGNIVIAIINLTFTPTFTTASGNFSIAGLPIAINSSIPPYGPVAIAATGVPAGTTNNVLAGSAGGTTISIVASGSAAQALWTSVQFTTNVQAVVNGTLTYLV